MQLVQSRFIALAKEALGEDGVNGIVEIGARDCAETLEFAAAFPQARIVAFECNPATLPACRAAVAGRDRIALVEKAVSNQVWTVRFYPTDPERTVTKHAGGNPGASSLFRAREDYPHETYVQSEIEVEATTLTASPEVANLPSIDLLWMDIQGAELLALEGLGGRITEVGLMHLEVEFKPIYHGQPLFEDVDRFLRARGFRLLGFTSYSRYSGDAVYAATHRLPIRTAGRFFARYSYLWRHLLSERRHRLKRALERLLRRVGVSGDRQL